MRVALPPAILLSSFHNFPCTTINLQRGLINELFSKSMRKHFAIDYFHADGCDTT
jgi:hypothetical protein